MSISTYAELQTAIGNWINRSDLTDRIPEFIALAEGKLNRKVRHYRQKVLVTTTYDTSITTRRIDYPSNQLEIINLQIKPSGAADTQYDSIKLIAPERIETVYKGSGRPDFYCLRGDIEFNRLADQTYTVRIHQMKRWALATDLTNWLLTNYPDAYVYGALLEASLYLNQDSRVAGWRDLYKDAIREINDESTRQEDDDESSVSELSMMGRNRSGYRVLTDDY
jgi:hypothetical protein